MLPSYREQPADLHSKSIDWFLYEDNTGIERVKSWQMFINYMLFFYFFFQKMWFTPCSAGRPLRGMGLQEKKGIQRWKAYSKTGYKETKDVRCLLTLDLKLFWSQVEEMHSTAKEFRGLTVRGKKNCWHWDPYNINSDRWIMEPIKTTGRSPTKKKESGTSSAISDEQLPR